MRVGLVSIVVIGIAAFVVAMLFVRPERGGFSTHELLARTGLERFELGAVEEGEVLVVALLVDGEVRQRLRLPGPQGGAVLFLQPGLEPGGSARPLDLRLVSPTATASSRPRLPAWEGALVTERVDAPDPALEGRAVLVRWTGSGGAETAREAVLAAWREAD